MPANSYRPQDPVNRVLPRQNPLLENDVTTPIEMADFLYGRMGEQANWSNFELTREIVENGPDILSGRMGGPAAVESQLDDRIEMRLVKPSVPLGSPDKSIAGITAFKERYNRYQELE